MSDWDSLSPGEKAARLARVEEADPRPDPAKILDRLLNAFDLSKDRTDAQAGWAAAERFARLAFPKEFGEEHDERLEEDWSEQRKLRLAATVMDLRRSDPKLSNTKAAEYLLAAAEAYGRIWPGPKPPSVGTLRNHISDAMRLSLVKAVEAGEVDRNGFIALYAVDPRTLEKSKKLHDK